MYSSFLLNITPKININIKYFYYLFAITIILLLLFLLYIRIKFRFWAVQPVFHIYDLHYYLFPPGIIRSDLPSKNRYCNFKNVDTIQFEKIEPFQLTRFAHFLQKEYLQTKNKENVFMPKKENIIPYFKNHHHPCFLSLYLEDELLLEAKTSHPIQNKKWIGVITSRPLLVNIVNKKDALFSVYYVDYLCIDKNHRKKGIAPQLIQTHEYNQSVLNKSIQVSLFKREGELTGIVPLCVFTTYAFYIHELKEPQKMTPSLGLVEVGKQNIHFLWDFMKENTNKFGITILPTVANLLELIKTKNMYCYIIVEDGEVLCAYFFKRQCTFIDKNVQVLSCIASINACKNPDIFVNGYKSAFSKIQRKNPTFQFAVIEDVSDNFYFLEEVLLLKAKSNHKHSVIESPTAYFFYNFAYPTFSSEKVFALT